MAIAFDEIPSNVLAPLFYAEVRGAQTPLNATLKLLLVGHRNETGFGKGNGDDNVPYLLSDSEVQTLFGRGSMLHMMYRYARKNARFAEIWGIAAAPDPDGTQAAGSIRVSGTPDRNEGFTLLIAGDPLEVVVRATDTPAVLASRIAARINARAYFPVKAAIDGLDSTKVNLTVKWRGYSGNAVDISKNYYGRKNYPAARLLTIVQPSGGVAAPGLAVALSALGDQQFDVFAIGFQLDEAKMQMLSNHFDGSGGRWSPYKQLYGHAVASARIAYGDLVTFFDDFNDPHLSVIASYGSPHPIWCWSAAVAAKMTQHWAAPPEISRPLQGLELVGLLPPGNINDWFNLTERNILMDYGVSPYRVDADRTVRIDRMRTLYKRNVWGDRDQSWSDAITLFQAQYFVKYMRGQITGTFPRAALTDEDSGIPGFTSPGQIYDLLVHAYRYLESLGLVENHRLFAKALVVERNQMDANRVDILARPDLVNQLRVVAALVETHLQLVEQVPVINPIEA